MYAYFKQIDSVQRLAAHYILGDSPYSSFTDMIDPVGMTSLVIRTSCIAMALLNSKQKKKRKKK